MTISPDIYAKLEQKYPGFWRLEENILPLLKISSSTWYKHRKDGNLPPGTRITFGASGYCVLQIMALLEFIGRHGMPRGKNQWPSMLDRGLELLAKKL